MSLNLLESEPLIFLGSRLKRLSDRFLADAAKIHEYVNTGVTPSQGVLLAHIGAAGEISVLELANMLGQSQPAISKNLVGLAKIGLIANIKCLDKRQRIVTLSEKGEVLLARISKEIWQSVAIAVNEILGEKPADFIEALNAIESRLDEKSFEKRFREIKMQKNNEIEIIEYDTQFAQDFYDINVEWIKDLFVMEQVDIDVLSNPQKFILDDGGAILLARHQEHGIVGTCALMKMGNGAFELTKMGVRKDLRGLKIGEKLLLATTDYAKNMGVKRLFLLSNYKNAAAIALYEKHGWKHSKTIMEEFGGEYERCDVAMEYEI